jgi:hypothetical protein
MKRNFTRFTRLLLLVLFPALSWAQENKDYNVMLVAGKFVPDENITNLAKSNPVFTASLFNNKYYVTIQFKSLPDHATRLLMKADGIDLVDYIPHLAYTAVVSSSVSEATLQRYNIRSIFRFEAAQKTVPAIMAKNIPSYAVKQAGYVDLDMVPYEKMSVADVAPAINALGGTIIADVPAFRMFTIRIPQVRIIDLVALPFVQWAEFIDPPNVPENLPGRVTHRVSVLQSGVRNLKGEGMVIGAWDDVCSPHVDFLPAGRLVAEAGTPGSHGTHLSGTIAGRGLLNPLARGMAPNATLHSYSGYDGPGGGGHFDNNLIQMATVIPALNMISSNHSYHDGLGVQCVIGGAATSYSLRARNADLNLNTNTFHLHCHSAGNAQGSCPSSSGFFSITGTGKCAKNNIVVGAVTGADAMTNYSSFGPSNDGRVKPEICAVGDAVFSTYTPLNSYNTISGTSMATPGIAGTTALLAQRYKELNGVLPPSALIKNVSCNTAQDLGNVGPDYRFGFGRINSLQAVRIIEENRYVLNTIATGANNDITINVPAGASRLRVMLTWNDPAAAMNASVALINNLDLRVIQGATTHLPWILNPNTPAAAATQADDNISNIEQVTVMNPPAGEYTLRVNGEAITTGPNQAYALTWDVNVPFIEVTYPNGGENFNPNGAQAITWDNSGVTANQTVEYSTDNGGSWNSIGSVSATTTRLNWTVPTVHTSQALIRITSGSLTDVSDQTFKILGTPTGFAVVAGGGCSSGEISFTWNAVTNATHYDIYRLDPALGDYVLVSGNVTGTAHTATGLTAGANMWFTIRAKNNTTNAESERAVAINGTVSSGGGGLGAIGSVSGQNLVCGNATNVSYSISAVTGATGYVWAAPPGAVIASGQGTTSILVNFPAGSSSGNVTVYATAGSCQTPTQTFAVTVGPVVAPATSGGDQTVTVCPGGPVPTLTATATVPAGHTVVWYNAATGGSVVASPTLSAAGTVTYYAAARNTSSGCESGTRVPVVLTINQVPSASISAGGPTTFCQGGNVVLTANSGSSYLWSNGAVTQSITVSTGGSYTVQVTTGSCVSNSPATVVTVNATPVASISASGATTFCQGLNVVLTASAGTSWLWSTGATTQSITVSTSGNYSVTVTNSAGCSATSSATTVTVNPNPPAIVSAGSATTFCNGGSVTLTANAGASYLWSNGATTQAITVSAPVGTTNYTVAVTQPGGCVSNSAAIPVTINPVPVADITAGGATTFCQGGNVVLTASAGSSWLWSTGATTQSITVSTSGNYTVTVTSAGCSATSTATAVVVSPNPQVTLTASPYSSLLPGLLTTLTANVTPPGTYNYAWFKNGLPVPGVNTSTLTNLDLDDLGSYTVTVTNTTGLPCSNSSLALVLKDSASSKLFIYPSPNNGQFAVRYHASGANVVNRLVIYDAKGAMVYNRAYAITSPYQKMDVNMDRNSDGLYRVVLFDKAGKKLADGTVLIQN